MRYYRTCPPELFSTGTVSQKKEVAKMNPRNSSMILIAGRAGVIGAAETLPTPAQGMMLFVIGLTAGIVLYFSAVFQGETCAACISLTSRKPEEGGRSLLFPIRYHH